MQHIINLSAYPLDHPGTPDYTALVARCQADLKRDGMFNLTGFLRAPAIATALKQLTPLYENDAFTHQRSHNIYFRREVPGLASDHPALAQFQTVNHTLCADQVPGNPVLALYDWPPFAAFLAAVMNKPALYPMDDMLACANFMAYNEGEALNWHFDRSEFTTTILLQAPQSGSVFEYRPDLRSADDPNYDGVTKLVQGKDKAVRSLVLDAGTLNVFLGKNTAHRVTPAKGPVPRIVAVLTFYETPGVRFSDEERMGFYGRTG